MMKSAMKGSISAITLVTLAACGVGGGGGGSSSSANTGFTSWSESVGSTVTVDGVAQTASYTSNSSGDVTSHAISDEQTTAQAKITTNDAGTITSLTLSTPEQDSVKFNTSNAQSAGIHGITAAESNDGRNMVVAANPLDLGWDYQSFGVWLTGYGTGAGTVGVASIGAATPAAAIPASGSATYTGYASGVYVDSIGQSFLALANMTANADFAARNVQFATSNTEVGNLNTSTTMSKPDLNLSGTLSYAQGQNKIAGNIQSVGGLSGKAAGQFYGPKAEEIGGTFLVRGAGNAGYMGAFGGKR